MPQYRKILPETKILPVPFPAAQGNGQRIEFVSGNNCIIFDIPDDAEGWYKVRVKAACAGGNRAGTEGYAEKVVYLFGGSRVIMWGASGRLTGYPEPTAKFGGYGGFQGFWIRKVS